MAVRRSSRHHLHFPSRIGSDDLKLRAALPCVRRAKHCTKRRGCIVTPTTPENCRAMALDCLWLSQQHAGAGRADLADRSVDRARELTVLALKLEQDSILSNSVPASSQALTDKPGSVTPPLSGTNSAVTV